MGRALQFVSFNGYVQAVSVKLSCGPETVLLKSNRFVLRHRHAYTLQFACDTTYKMSGYMHSFSNLSSNLSRQVENCFPRSNIRLF